MEISNFLFSIVDKGQLQILADLLGANLILGVIASIAKGKFELIKLQDFWKRALVVFGGYVAVALASKGLADFEPLRTAAWVAMMAYLAANIVGNLKDIGIPVPAGLMKYIER